MKKWIFLGVLLLLAVFCGIAFYILSLPTKEKLSDSFKEKAIGQLLGRKAQLNANDEKSGNTTFNGKYITFSYPAKAIEYTYRDPSVRKNDSILEDFIFDMKNPRLRFVMSVLKNSSNLVSVTDDPSVRLRENRGYEYVKGKFKIGGVEGNSYFKKGQEAEKSGFFIYMGRIYTVVASGNSEKDVVKLFDDVIASAKTN